MDAAEATHLMHPDTPSTKRSLSQQHVPDVRHANVVSGPPHKRRAGGDVLVSLASYPRLYAKLRDIRSVQDLLNAARSSGFDYIQYDRREVHARLAYSLSITIGDRVVRSKGYATAHEAAAAAVVRFAGWVAEAELAMQPKARVVCADDSPCSSPAAHLPQSDASRGDAATLEVADGGEAADVRIVHITDPRAVRETTRIYAHGTVFKKKHHEDALKSPGDVAVLLLAVATASPPYPDARAILIYTRAKRACVHLVHTRDEWVRRGYALRLARAIQDEVPVRGSLTVDSPGCTAAAAVSVWLRAHFMPDEELLKCVLADDAAYMGGRSVRLTFTWNKSTTAADEEARILFLKQVARKHPELTRVCEAASSLRV